MRAFAAALAALAAAVPGAVGQTVSPGRVAFLRGGQLVVLDLGTRRAEVVMREAGTGPVHWSGNGRLVSSGGRIAGGPSLPTAELEWAPTGERAALQTKSGAIVLWSPAGGRRTIVPPSWGATSFAWGPNGDLAIGRSVCHRPCGIPTRQEVWIWRHASLRLVAGPLRGRTIRPIIAGVAPTGRALWWADLEGSASLAADGLTLYADRMPLASTLVFRDFVVRCGRHLALAIGTDRYATHGKRILLDGRDVSRDRTRSWVSPSCSADGRTLVAAAGRNWEESRIGRGELRSIWQLLPTRERLTHAPAGWTDEDPHVLPDGSILFVRTNQSSRKLNGEWVTATRGFLELLQRSRLTRLARIDVTSRDSSGYFLNYYGHYQWPWLVAVAP